jgi:hypothetical protein
MCVTKGEGYQTSINRALREYITQQLNGKNSLSSLQAASQRLLRLDA